MAQTKEKLESAGYKVLMPHLEFEDFHEIKNEKGEFWRKKKAEFMRDHFRKIRKSDAILVLNYDKEGVKGYVGGNTLLDIAVAYEHDKKIFLLNSPTPDQPYSDEIQVINPTILNGNLDLERIV
jgi:uncharacterized ferredoxin-like protein